jgi:hypothetical protein
MGLFVITKWRSKSVSFNVMLILSLVFISAGALQADDGSGLSLSLYGDPAYPDFQYTLSDNPAEEPIKLIIVLKNVSGQPINMERGLSQVELSQTLEVIDPCGDSYELSPETDVFAYDAPPSFRVGGRPTIPAEILSSSFAKSMTISDLRELFPVMKRIPGLYTIKAQLGSKRFVWTVYISEFGLLGVSDHPDNWSGDIEAKEMKIYLSPAFGGQLNVQVVDNDDGTSEPLFMVPVKVFKKSTIPAELDLADIWVKVEPVLSGQTDNQGQAVWGSCSACVPRDDYVAIAYHQDDYYEVPISAEEGGWAPGCGGLIEKTIGGAEGPQYPLSEFSLFALNSIYIMPYAIVYGGNIGVQSAIDGTWLNSNAEVTVGYKADVKAGCQLFGDSIKIAYKAKVWDVFYNELDNRGTISGDQHTPLELPVADKPAFVESIPGVKNITVNAKKTKIIGPGPAHYRDIAVKAKGKLILTGGEYHFMSLDVGSKASLECAGPSKIYVHDRAKFRSGAYVGPAASADISAADIIFYVGGTDGKSRWLIAKQKAVDIDFNTKITANLYAPNGTLSIGLNAKLHGAFIARDVLVGLNAKVWHDSAF